MPISPVRGQRLYVQIVRQIMDLIAQNEFAPESQLPSERELAERLGVARASLREALSALEVMGLVETRHGAGTFITATPVKPLLLPDLSWLSDQESPSSLLQVRQAVEPGFAALAARVKAPKGMQRMEAVLGRLESNIDKLEWRNQADREFHSAVAAATGNPVADAVSEFLCTLMGQALWRNLDFYVDEELGRMRQFWAQHRLVFEAIKAGDQASAAQHMLGHLLGVERTMLEPNTED